MKYYEFNKIKVVVPTGLFSEKLFPNDCGSCWTDLDFFTPLHHFIYWSNYL